MGFFNFFKRDISEEEFQEQQKVKRGLEKTRTGFFQSIVNTLTNAQIDDDLYDQLEEQLILADVGPACAVRLVDELHDEVKEKHLKTGQEALDALRGIICQELTPRYPMDLDGKPAVILVIGVNGVGKTTTIAKLAGLYKKQGAAGALGRARRRAAGPGRHGRGPGGGHLRRRQERQRPRLRHGHCRHSRTSAQQEGPDGRAVQNLPQCQEGQPRGEP